MEKFVINAPLPITETERWRRGQSRKSYGLVMPRQAGTIDDLIHNRWVVYRLFLEDVLVYVGMSGSWPTRLHTHLTNGIKFDRYELEPVESKGAAFKREQEVIHSEHPLLNSETKRFIGNAAAHLAYAIKSADQRIHDAKHEIGEITSAIEITKAELIRAEVQLAQAQQKLDDSTDEHAKLLALPPNPTLDQILEAEGNLPMDDEI